MILPIVGFGVVKNQTDVQTIQRPKIERLTASINFLKSIFFVSPPYLRILYFIMFVKTYNQQGEETGKTELPSEIFDVKMSPDLVHQIVVSQMANRRQKIAQVKTRGEVRGGGRKPWRQKGTGRARVGSIRSPLWKGGGITFGPTKEKKYDKIIPKKMRRKALFMVLSQKVKDNELLVLDELKIGNAKTKEITKIIQDTRYKIQDTKKAESFLIALPKIDKDIILASRNIPKVATIQARDLNCLDILSYKYLMMPEEAIKVMKETFL